MSLRLGQIEKHYGKARAGVRRWMKNQRNRKLRRLAKSGKDVNIKFKGY